SQGKLEQAVDAYLSAERASPDLGHGPTGALFQHELASLYARLGDDEHHLACLQRLRTLDASDVHRDGVGSQIPVRTIGSGERISSSASASWHARVLATVRDACAGCVISWRWLGTLAVLGLTA